MNSERLKQYIVQPFDEVVESAARATKHHAGKALAGAKSGIWLALYPVFVVLWLLAILMGIGGGFLTGETVKEREDRKKGEAMKELKRRYGMLPTDISNKGKSNEQDS